jgi:uncharacterized membrane protein YgdD (TMEM256/DUF423 family)
MNTNAQHLISVGAILAFLGVALGAFGAHALKARLAADMMAIYQTGVQYHLWHALGVILIGVLAQLMPASKWMPLAGWAMIVGVAIFSGSLYALSLSGVRVLGAVTPVGGVLLLAAWAMLAYGAMQRNQ